MSDMGQPLDRYAEVETGEAFTLQNPRLLKVELSETSVMARNGAMVAYQGDVRFEHKGGGMGRLLKKAATGESLRLMEATGSGELFLASPGMLAGGLFNVALRGTGLVALVSDGEPLRLDVGEAPVFADPQAAIAWSGGVTTSLRADVQAKTLIGLGSGESFQLGFAGSGLVLVQPSEGRRGVQA